VKGVRKDGVTQEHGGGRTISTGGCLAPAAQVGPVHDVVVHQRCQVDHLNHRGRADQGFANGKVLAATAQEDQGGADAFAGGVDAIVRHLADLRFEDQNLLVQQVVQPGHVRLEPEEHLPEDREDGNGNFRQEGHGLGLKLGAQPELAS